MCSINMHYVRVSFANRDREGGYKRGVVRSEVLGHVHNHDSQIQTLKRIKLHKLNTNAQYTIVAM